MKRLLCALLVVGLAAPAWAGITAARLEYVAENDSVPYIRDAAQYAIDIADDFEDLEKIRGFVLQTGNAAYITGELAEPRLFGPLMTRYEVEEDVMKLAWERALGGVLMEDYTIDELEAILLADEDEDLALEAAHAALALTEALVAGGETDWVAQRISFQLTNPAYADAELLKEAYINALGFLWAAGL